MAKRQDDEEWTPLPCSSKQISRPSPIKKNCILHGNKKDFLNILCTFLLSLNRLVYLSTYMIIMKSKILKQTSDCGGMFDVCETIPSEMLPGCGYYESCRRAFFHNGYCALANIKISESNQTSCQHIDGTVLFGTYSAFDI